MSELETITPQFTSQEPALAHGNIMIVDDTPANLRLLEEMLREQRYTVRSFTRARLALAAAAQHRPDAILLDIMMPEMDGYRMCERLKADPTLAETPVIFLSGLSAAEDKVKGFRVGGADFVCKPFQLEEVNARVEMQLKLARARQAERDLLEKTLNGIVSTLFDLLQLTSPILTGRSNAIRDVASHVAGSLAIPGRWRIELAAQLALLGCITIPVELFQRAYREDAITDIEEASFRGHPRVGAEMVSKIPRLEGVGIIIRHQLGDPTSALPSDKELASEIGLLQAVIAFDRKMADIRRPKDALAEMRRAGTFDPRCLAALEEYAPSRAAYELCEIGVRDLQPGMVLDCDVVTRQYKAVIMSEGSVLNPVWIRRLINFAGTGNIDNRLRVRVPRG